MSKRSIHSEQIQKFRRSAYSVVLLQIFVVCVVAGIWGLFKAPSTISSILSGGLVCVIPNFFFARWSSVLLSPRRVKQNLLIFFVAEFLKLLLSALLAMALLLLARLPLFPFILGFIAAQFACFLSPCVFFLKDGHKKSKEVMSF